MLKVDSLLLPGCTRHCFPSWSGPIPARPSQVCKILGFIGLLGVKGLGVDRVDRVDRGGRVLKVF